MACLAASAQTPSDDVLRFKVTIGHRPVDLVMMPIWLSPQSDEEGLYLMTDDELRAFVAAEN